ncbi:hypothetical protein QUF64_09375 [Anaerolineales bacterium HSG6]|nr:hypothetical protein [Anaerolineales bacterium HSG6]
MSNFTPVFLRDRYLWLTLLLSLPIVGPLLQPGYFWGGHDARHSVYFLHQFDQAIQDGVWYPRWAPDFAFGYGYPFFNIYGPLSSYLGEILHLFGLDIVNAVKCVFGLSAVLCGLTMYLFMRDMLTPKAGVISALTYVYLPYHLFDLYVRAALAESVGFVFVPLAMWGFFRTVTRPTLMTILGAAVAYALIMFTSNLLALIFTPIFGLYVAFMMTWQFFRDPIITTDTSVKPTSIIGWLTPAIDNLLARPNRYIRFIRTGLSPLLALFLGLGISGIFWIPAFLEYRFVRVDQWIGGRFAFGDDFVALHQLFSPAWGFGASIPGPDDEAGFQIGVAALILYILSFVVVPQLTDTLTRRTLYFFQGFTALVIFLTVPISSLVWTYLPLSSFAQFPWRLLVVVAPFISVMAGTVLALPVESTVDSTSNKPTILPYSPQLPLVILSSLIILSSYPYLEAQLRDPKPTEGPVSQASLFRFQQSSDEMTGQTAWTREIPNWSTLAEQVERGGQITTKVNYTALPKDDSVGVYSMEMDSIHELLWVGTEQPNQHVTFFIPYYPGWNAYIYEDLGPHDGNLDKSVGEVLRVGSVIDRPSIKTTDREGWIIVSIPTGSHFLEIRFEDTIVRVIGYWVSMLSLGILIIAIILNWKFKQSSISISLKT